LLCNTISDLKASRVAVLGQEAITKMRKPDPEPRRKETYLRISGNN